MYVSFSQRLVCMGGLLLTLSRLNRIQFFTWKTITLEEIKFNDILFLVKKSIVNLIKRISQCPEMHTFGTKNFLSTFRKPRSIAELVISSFPKVTKREKVFLRRIQREFVSQMKDRPVVGKSKLLYSE